MESLKIQAVCFLYEQQKQEEQRCLLPLFLSFRDTVPPGSSKTKAAGFGAIWVLARLHGIARWFCSLQLYPKGGEVESHTSYHTDEKVPRILQKMSWSRDGLEAEPLMSPLLSCSRRTTKVTGKA
jgi:hypothetical protein